MALKVLSADQLQELLLSIGRNGQLLKERKAQPHHSLVDWIQRVLSDISSAGSQPLSDAIIGRLDGFESELRELLVESQQCKCKDCTKRSEAA